MGRPPELYGTLSALLSRLHIEGVLNQVLPVCIWYSSRCAGMHVRHGLSNAVCGVQAAVPVGQQLDLLARPIAGRFYSARWLGAGLWDDPADGAGSAQ